jgi:hypothetical protein
MNSLSPDTLGRLLIKRATDFVGLAEARQNAVWDNPRTKQWEVDQHVWLRTRMRELGWKPGQPYCAAFVGAVVSDVLEGCALSQLVEVWQDLWTPHVMTNFHRLNKLGLVTSFGGPGDLWLAQLYKRGKATDNGHTGIVTAVKWEQMATVEGNTSPGSQDNTGDGIYTRLRHLRQQGVLTTRGFVSPSALLRLISPKH